MNEQNKHMLATNKGIQWLTKLNQCLDHFHWKRSIQWSYMKKIQKSELKSFYTQCFLKYNVFMILKMVYKYNYNYKFGVIFQMVRSHPNFQIFHHRSGKGGGEDQSPSDNHFVGSLKTNHVQLM